MLDLLNLPGVTPVDIRTEEGTILISADADAESPECLDCTKPMHRHGHRTGSFADTPMQMQPVRLEITRPRFRCDACGSTITPELAFLDERRRATRRLVDAIRQRCLATTFHDLAKHTGMAVNTIKNIAQDLIAELEQTVRFETPVIMGIDEVNLAGGMRCIITNLATSSVFQMLEERTQAKLKPFFKALPDRAKVEWVCTDMWRPFKQSFGPYLPNARLVIDKFHVVRMASDALEQERKKYQKQLDRESRLHIKKSIRWLTLKRPGNLNGAEKAALNVVKQSLPSLAMAYDLKEAFYCIYDEPDKGAAMRAFEAWRNVLPSDMPGFRVLAKTVQNHYDDIFAYWDTPLRITNAYTEAVNGVVKVANRMGRGYSYEIIRAKTLYSKHARNVGSGVSKLAVPTTGAQPIVEYGPHIPTLLEITESGELE